MESTMKVFQNECKNASGMWKLKRKVYARYRVVKERIISKIIKNIILLNAVGLSHILM